MIYKASYNSFALSPQIKSCLHLVLYLKRAFVFDRPYTESDRDDRHKHERDEDEHPGVCLSLEIVTGQDVEHEQHQMEACRNHHRLVLHEAVTFQSVCGFVVVDQ